jgi:hypothetical protein
MMKENAGIVKVKIVKTHMVRKNYDYTSKRGSTQRPNWRANWRSV